MLQDREKSWRALWQARKSGQEFDELPPLPPFFASAHAGGMNQLNSHINTYATDGLNYRPGDDSSLCNTGYGATNSSGYQGASTLQYPGTEGDVTGDGHRATRYSSYTYTSQSTNRDPSWPQTIAPSHSSGAESGAPTSSSHSPGYVESPTLTSSEIGYVAQRFSAEDQKLPLNNLEPAPYVFQSNRSLSPTSTPGSSSSTSLTSPFQFTFSDSTVNERDHFYRRQSNGMQMTLHGGTADISIAGSTGDALRYRLGNRRTNPSVDRPLLPALALSAEHGSPNERGSSDGDPTSYSTRHRPRRSLPSRSPSPGAVPRSATLAVIKAQAFGALRRTRTKTKRSTEASAKAAMDVLENRAIGLGVVMGTKRARTDIDDGEMHQT